MEQHFSQIKKEYDGFYRFLLKKGKFPYRDTKIGVWGPSVTDEVFEIFKKIRLNRFKSFIDLGSGDGKVTLIASLFTKAEGVEFDPWLFNVSKNIQSKLSHIPGIKDAVFHNKDFMKHHLDNYSVVFIAPDKPLHRGIENKIREELNGKLIHYGHHFHPEHMERELAFHVNGTLVSIYSNNKK
ncbi:hypothetical protein JXA85_01890 [Candidatus Woesearchaeota archaeon]|nr:hypothetical protein [Candidatus Woesearchaeota archaeon]